MLAMLSRFMFTDNSAEGRVKLAALAFPTTLSPGNLSKSLHKELHLKALGREL